MMLMVWKGSGKGRDPPLALPSASSSSSSSCFLSRSSSSAVRSFKELASWREWLRALGVLAAAESASFFLSKFTRVLRVKKARFDETVKAQQDTTEGVDEAEKRPAPTEGAWYFLRKELTRDC